MPKEITLLVEETPEGEHIALALGHTIFTEANTWDELNLTVQDAVRCHFGNAMFTSPRFSKPSSAG